jgi:cyanophycinase
VLAPLALLLAAASAAAQAPGRLVIIGGGLSRTNEAVYRAVLDGRRGAGPLCVIPTAGANPATAYQSTVETFDRHGGVGTATGILIDMNRPETARDAEVVAQIRRCSGFYFIGGVQSRILSALRPNGELTPALAALLERFREGAVVAGSSAGAAIMSDPMIAGGSSVTAVASGIRRGATGGAGGAAAADEDETDARGVAITAGLGFLPDALVDQHFLARGRIGRLIVAVLELAEVDLGFGIDENTALVVEGDDAWPVGASGVVILDERGARRDGRSIAGLRLHLMSEGDRFRIRTRELTVAADKTPLAPASRGVDSAAPSDLFARWRFLHLLDEFARVRSSEVAVPIEGGRIVVSKAAEFRARSRGVPGVQSTPAGLTITGLVLELRR